MDDTKLLSRIAYLFGEDTQVAYPNKEYLDYVTPADIFDIVINNIICTHPDLSTKVVWDMFAGIGTDSLRLARHAGKVIATEINTDTFRCLQQNTMTDSVANIEINNDDCCSMANKINPDIIYFDPPWGTSFKSGQPFTFDDILLPNGKNATELLLDLYSKHTCAFFIIKAPYMCDIEKNIPEDDIICILTFNRQKLKYIFAQRPQI